MDMSLCMIFKSYFIFRSGRQFELFTTCETVWEKSKWPNETGIYQLRIVGVRISQSRQPESQLRNRFSEFLQLGIRSHRKLEAMSIIYRYENTFANLIAFSAVPTSKPIIPEYFFRYFLAFLWNGFDSSPAQYTLCT